MSEFFINDTDKNNKCIELHFAAAQNDLLQIENLLFQRANVNAEDVDGKTPLHYVAIKNVGKSHLKVAETLLKSGANSNARSNNGKTPLHHLVKKGDLEIVQLFFKFKANLHILDNMGESILFQAACFNKNVEVVQLLIDLGSAVDHRCNGGRTPLHWSCSTALLNGNIEVTKCLLTL